MDKNAKPKETIKKAIKIKLATLGTTLAIKLIPMLILIVTAVSIVDFIVEIFTAKNTPEKIYEELSIEDVADLIEIKGNKEDGYYLDFIEGIDEELEQLIETLNASGEYHNVPQDKEFLKKIIKAEAVIKFPNLGGKIPEGSTGFQGAIDVKRVTPNKAVGEMVNKGKGETNILEPESAYTDSQMTPKEEEIKKWEKGKELVLSADSILYEKKEGKWMQKYYKDSKTPIKIKYTNTVTYTGKYEVSEDKLNKTNVIYVEVKGKDLIDGEEVTGYIRSININIRSTNEGVWALEENTELEVIRDGVIVYEKFGNSNFNEKRDPSNMLEKIKAKTTDKIIYKGEYEKENKLTYEGDVYYIKVKIERENENGKTEIIDDDNTYLKFSDLEVKQESTEKEETSSRAKTKPKKEKITVGGDKEEYVVAIAAGHNNDNDKGAQEGDLIEEELTIKVAEKVEELVEEKYENVKVVQTGSTSKNPGGVQVRDRKELAKRAKPALCIQIHFNAADSPDANGVEAIYKDGDGISQQLAEILSRTISEEMELNDRKAGPDVEKCAVGSLGIIENAAYSKFPSVVTEGGFITNSKDAEVIRNGGIDKYAEGIVVGIKEYLEADHSGYSSHATGESTETSSIESRVFNMKYLSPEELEEMKSEDVDKAMKYFTLNDDKKLVSLSWTMQEDGTIEIKENSAVDFRTSLQKYMMPFEYLLYFYMDTEYRGFSEKLADIVLDSEIVMTLQDNVTTSQVSVTEETKTEKKNKVEWEITSSTGGAISETCGTRTDITYIETWCVKVYKDNSYSKKVLKMGDKEEIIVDAPGKVTETEDATYEEWITEDGTEKRKETKTHRISNSYDTSGDRKVEGVTNKFVDLYIKEEMNARIKEDWLFLILENNEKTVNLLDLTKYLMFLASNTDYGVTEFDFSTFDFSSFQETGSQMGLLVEYIHYFEHSTPPPTNADGTKYIIENDGAGNAVVGYGVDIFNGGFVDEFTQAGYPTHIGGEVDKEFVDNLERREIQECLDAINSITAGLNLKGYQINALVSRAFNCGIAGAVSFTRGSPSMNFVDSYNTYWNESDDQFEAKDSNANFTHSLYTQYMAKPVTAQGYGYMPGLETRRKSEWILFQTGYYDVLDKWHSEGGSGETIPANGDGYDHEYTSSTGRTYREYKQWKGSYSNMIFSYYKPQTLAQAGCSITSVAVVTSGYNNNQTPGTLATETPVLADLMTKGGAECIGYETADAARLTSGKPAVVNISGTLITERGTKYYGGHYIAILDGRNGNEVYVSDVGANDIYCGGWTDVQNIINIVKQGVLYVKNE